MKKKIFSIFLAIVLLFGCFVLPASAAEKDEKPGRSFIWSPFCSTNVGEYFGVNNQRVLVNSTFYWDQLGAATINVSHYTTMEHSMKDKLPFDVYSQYSNAGNVYFDTDDDDRNGGAEESEVIFLNKVSPNFNYVFNTEFLRMTNGPKIIDDILTVCQRSYLFIEYQAEHYDFLNVTSFTSQAMSRTSLGKQNPVELSSADESLERGDERASITFRADETNLNSLTSHYEQQLVSFSEEQANQIGRRSVPERTVVTVTFNHSISMQEMAALLDGVGGELKIYHAKFISDTGDWCSVGTKEMDENAMVDWANERARLAGYAHESYEGIVSMEVEMLATANNVNFLNNSDLVFGVDLSEYLYTHSDEYTPSIRAIVPHYAFEVANF